MTTTTKLQEEVISSGEVPPSMDVIVRPAPLSRAREAALIAPARASPVSSRPTRTL